MSRAVHIHSHVHYSGSEYTREDNICASACVVGIVFNPGQHRRRRPRLFAIEYFNEYRVYIHKIGFKFLFGNPMYYRSILVFRVELECDVCDVLPVQAIACTVSAFIYHSYFSHLMSAP